MQLNELHLIIMMYKYIVRKSDKICMQLYPLYLNLIYLIKKLLLSQDFEQIHYIYIFYTLLMYYDVF